MFRRKSRKVVLTRWFEHCGKLRAVTEWYKPIGGPNPRAGQVSGRSRSRPSPLLWGYQMKLVPSARRRGRSRWYAWERDVVAALLPPDTVVVDTGLPGWRRERPAAVVQTFGAGRFNLQGRRRGPAGLAQAGLRPYSAISRPAVSRSSWPVSRTISAI